MPTLVCLVGWLLQPWKWRRRSYHWQCCVASSPSPVCGGEARPSMSVETREARAPNACAGARAHINTQPLSCIFVQQQPRGLRFFFFICFVSFGGGCRQTAGNGWRRVLRGRGSVRRWAPWCSLLLSVRRLAVFTPAGSSYIIGPPPPLLSKQPLCSPNSQVEPRFTSGHGH